MTERGKTSALRVAALEQRHRDRGEVQRKRWARPESWPLIDQFIQEIDSLGADGKRKYGILVSIAEAQVIEAGAEAAALSINEFFIQAALKAASGLENERVS